MSNIRISTLLQTGKGKKIRVVSMGEYLVPKGAKVFALNIFDGHLKELIYDKSKCIMLTKSEVPIKALDRKRAVAKAQKHLSVIQSNINPDQIIHRYAH